MKQPRDYQNAAHQSLWNYVHTQHNKNPLVVMATGLGKSLNMSMFIWHMLITYSHLRIMQVTHVKELVQGNYEELKGIWPQAPAGIYAAGLKRKETANQITFAMINSVAKKAANFGHIDFLIIDEAHRLSDKDTAMYKKFIKELKQKNKNLIVIGFTATPYRMTTGSLLDGDLFDDICFDIGSGESFIWAVEQGYLIMPMPTDPGFQVDDSAIGISAGDYKTSEASAAFHEQDIIERAISYSIKIAREENRRSAICFAQSIEDAELIAEMLTHEGFPTMPVHSKRNDRDAVLAAHKKGELWGVTNKDILTTGWNNPLVDLFMGLRLTRSPGLWCQMIGRMTRPVWLPGFDISTREGRLASIQASGKTTARILDFAGNTLRLGPINYPNLPRRRGKAKGEPPVRTCSYDSETKQGCSPTTYHHVSVKICPYCGYEFPKKSNLKETASTQDIVTEKNPLETVEKVEKKYEIFDVHEMIAVLHHGKEKYDKKLNKVVRRLDTVRVNYRSGHRTFPVWLGFGHGKKEFPRYKAHDWWKKHGGLGEAPTICQEAVDKIPHLNKPKFIKVWINTSYPEIVDYDFKGTKFEVFSADNECQLHEVSSDPLLFNNGVAF